MGRIYRVVEVKNKEKSRISIAIVDSGADESVISERLAKQINAEFYGEFEALCASGTDVKGKYADVVIKDIWSGKEAKMEVGVADAPFDTDDIDEEGVEVIIGVDFLQENDVKLDFRKESK